MMHRRSFVFFKALTSVFVPILNTAAEIFEHSVNRIIWSMFIPNELRNDNNV